MHRLYGIMSHMPPKEPPVAAPSPGVAPPPVSYSPSCCPSCCPLLLPRQVEPLIDLDHRPWCRPTPCQLLPQLLPLLLLPRQVEPLKDLDHRSATRGAGWYDGQGSLKVTPVDLRGNRDENGHHGGALDRGWASC